MRSPEEVRLSWAKPAALVLAVAALTAAGCGSGSDGRDATAADSAAGQAPAVSTKGLPKPLAENIEQANQIIDGGQPALDQKLVDLRGFPVVVNKWASWCGPCRAEFPYFAESASAHADDVAFLGLDSTDDRGAAETFLDEFPVPYPSIFDPDGSLARSLEMGKIFPGTAFIDEKGEIVQVRFGGYASRDQLEADIERLLLED